MVWKRPASYMERRADGYREPELVFIVGTAHVSRQSARDVERVIAAVRPCAVVVELCKSRSAVMWSEEQPPAEGQPGWIAEVAATSDDSSEVEASGSSRRPNTAERNITEEAEAAGTGCLPSPLRRPKGASTSNLMQISGDGGRGGFFSTMQRSVQLGGQSALLLRVLLSNLAGVAAGMSRYQRNWGCLGISAPGVQFRCSLYTDTVKCGSLLPI